MYGPGERTDSLYFFPDRSVTAPALRRVLRDGSREERALAVSQMLRYAQWDDLWSYVSRDEVRALFPYLDLPAGLRSAWARMLKIEATAEVVEEIGVG